MAIPAGHRVVIEFDTVFPEGAYVTGVEPVAACGAAKAASGSKAA